MFQTKFIEKIILLAQKEAAKAIKRGDSPFGAVLTDDKGRIIAVAHNAQNTKNDPSAHAEIELLRKAGKKLGRRDFSGYYIFGNAEPCSMCSSACIKSKIRHFYFGAPHEPSMDPNLNIFDVAKKSKKKVFIKGNILAKECAAPN